MLDERLDGALKLIGQIVVFEQGKEDKERPQCGVSRRTFFRV